MTENVDPTIQNEDNYEDLLVTIEASQGVLAILIAVCDYGSFRDEIITRYETELAPEIRNYRVELPRGEPSMRAAISEVVQKDEYLQNGGKAVFTVTGAENLFFLKLGAERSEQEIFFGYLQWTREALRDFRYPIILWVTNQILVELSKKAPDFWSWRKGVFRFTSKQTALIPNREIAPFRVFLIQDGLSINDDDNYFLPLEDLQQLIAQIEREKGDEDPLLASLYARMGEIYQGRLKKGEAQDYQKEQELAIEYFQKAIKLDKNRLSFPDLTRNVNNLADLYLIQGKYEETEKLYLQWLEMSDNLLGQQPLYIASSLSNLANVYSSKRRMQEAENLYLKALQLYKNLPSKEALIENEIGVAEILNNLASLYRVVGRYSEAEDLYLQALEIYKRIWGENHINVAFILNNLALNYEVQGRYSEAEPLYLQALILARGLLPIYHPINVDIRKNLDELRAKISTSNTYPTTDPTQPKEG